MKLYPLFLLFFQTSLSQPHYMIWTKPNNFINSKAVCLQKKLQLSSMDLLNLSSKMNLKKEMEKVDGRHQYFWIGLERKGDKNYDGIYSKRRISMQMGDPVVERYCGAINTKTFRIVSVNCEVKLPFICSKSDKTSLTQTDCAVSYFITTLIITFCVILVSFLIYCCFCRKKRKRNKDKVMATPVADMTTGFSSFSIDYASNDILSDMTLEIPCDNE